MRNKNNLIAGVMGDPISHSKSPLLFRHWFNEFKIQGQYVPLKVIKEDLEQVLATLPKIGFLGLNVTIPHKEQVLNFADKITPRAKNIGAANTLTFLPDGGFKADNTDGFGFLANLKEHQENWCPVKCIPLVLGSGGASRSVISSLLDEGVPIIYITNRTLERAQELGHFFGPRIKVIKWKDKKEMLSSINLLVNTTSLGMIGNEDLGLSLDNISQETTVVDLVYNPIKTLLLQDAEIQGCRCVDGLGMLLHQATPGFEEWFGTKPSVDSETRQMFLSK